MILLDYNSDLALFLLRLVIAIIFFGHGPVKLMKSKLMASSMGMNASLLFLAGVFETLGALLLLLGLYTQIGAVLLGIVMVGAIYMKTQRWGKKFMGENGWELDFLMLGALLAIFFIGPGQYTLLG